MFGTESDTELTRKYERVKVQNDIHTFKHIYYTSGVLEHKYRASLIVR